MAKKKNRATEWFTIDLHTHTPASSDFQQPEVTSLQWLQRAENRGLDIIAVTDHNTVAGYRRLQEEIDQLEMLQKLNRLLPEELARLTEYHRLLDKILVLPGFEFTATFGFHILAIFSPSKPVREIEYLLISLNIRTEQLDDGSANVGATTDVLTAYKMIAEAGGLVIAAHANSSNGVAMRGFPMGGQTKIAYTQDAHLHALEVTDLEQRGPRTTAAFFNGTKPEYPRRMHCIQGSDAHRLTADPQRKKILGLGDRATDASLPEVSFEALKELFLSNDFARTRPHRAQAEPAYDFIRAAREEGSNIVQSFHENANVRGGNLYAILADVCAFANTNGGSLYIGLNSNSAKPVVGIPNPEQVTSNLEKETSSRITPPLSVTIDVHETNGKKVLRVLVPRGDDPPYVVDDYKVYIRNEAETELAVRDEIVNMVLRGQVKQENAPLGVSFSGLRERLELTASPSVGSEVGLSTSTGTAPAVGPGAVQSAGIGSAGEPLSEVANPSIPSAMEPPRTGVEVASVEERGGKQYFTLRDLRNGNVVKNVTQASARRLWHYAIKQYARLPADLSKANIVWEGGFGLLRRYQEGKHVRFDLVQRDQGGMRFYFGVTEDGVHGGWRLLLGAEAGEEDE